MAPAAAAAAAAELTTGAEKRPQGPSSISRRCRRLPTVVVPSASNSPSPSNFSACLRRPFTLFAVLLFCLAQQRTANAFLLSHRNLLVPFASSKGAALPSMREQEQQEDQEEITGAVESPMDQEEMAAIQQQAQSRQQPIRLLGFMAVPKRAMNAFRWQTAQRQVAEEEQQQQQQQQESLLPASSRPRRKRMHHLSILRKVGTPSSGGGIRGNRLFGPQKQPRELKRTVPLFLIEY